MWTTLTAAALHIVVLAGVSMAATRPADASESAGVRPLTRGASALLEEGARRSSLMQSQIAFLAASDLVVYVTEVFVSAPGQPKGRLRFISAAGGRRYAIVCLDRWMLSWNDRLVVLAHELQHAVEIARAKDVTDMPSFRALYSRIGWQPKPGYFETEEALQATARMRLDLKGGRPVLSAPAADPVPEPQDDGGRNSRRNRRTP